ncbi:MAG: Transcription termination protein NusA [Parcubacteria group bacterium GW2011_GWC1_38_6]|nr:MAG: Transcription termination protein NusA [Parcubacteria group bacterium GW2011_GWC1_38_6]
MQTPRTEFAQALKAIASERGLDAGVILEAIKQAIVAAFRRDAKDRGEELPEELVIDAEINSLDGGAKVLIEGKDVTPPGFGRIAAQTAKQVIHQKIREAERGVIMEEFSGRIGSLVSGIVLRFDGPNVRVDMGRTEGIMPAEERTPSERLSQGQRLTFLLKDIVENLKGKDIILSRADPQFVSKLFAREVPEFNAGTVEVKAISREAGVRTKIAVYSTASGVDPVGSCVGQKGVRVQAVTNELGGERVDVITYSEDAKELIKSALSPADNLSVKANKKTMEAVVTAPEDQLSMAIGKDGQNVRLASKLTGYRIEVVGITPTEEEKKTDISEDVEKKEQVTEDAQTDTPTDTPVAADDTNTAQTDDQNTGSDDTVLNTDTKK